MNILKFLSVCLLFVSMTHAELPPRVYAKMKKDAQEHLIVSAKSVESTFAGANEKKYTVKCRVREPIRSANHLKKGDTITVVYRRIFFHPPGWVGPSEPIVLKEGGIYDVYLKRCGDNYCPAARGWSFSKTE